MKVFVQEFNIEMEVKNKGFKLEIYSPDGSNRLGDIRVTKTALVWCNGRANDKKKVTWNKFIEWVNEE